MSRYTLLVLTVLGLMGGQCRSRLDDMRVLATCLFPDGATDVSFMKRRGDIRFQVTSDFKTAGDFYAKKLVEQNWKKYEKDNLQSDFWVQKYVKRQVVARSPGRQPRWGE